MYIAGAPLAQTGSAAGLALGAGLAAYEPPLTELRAALAAAGGGGLELQPDRWGRSLSVSVARLGRAVGTGRQGLEASYTRFLGRAGAGDFRLEVERYAGGVLHLRRSAASRRLQSLYGVGPVLLRLRREGQVSQRTAPPVTRTDWVWGLCTWAGADAFVGRHLAVGARYAYDLVRATAIDGLTYETSGGTASFCLTWYPR